MTNVEEYLTELLVQYLQKYHDTDTNLFVETVDTLGQNLSVEISEQLGEAVDFSTIVAIFAILHSTMTIEEMARRLARRAVLLAPQRQAAMMRLLLQIILEVLYRRIQHLPEPSDDDRQALLNVMVTEHAGLIDVIKLVVKEGRQ